MVFRAVVVPRGRPGGVRSRRCPLLISTGKRECVVSRYLEKAHIEGADEDRVPHRDDGAFRTARRAEIRRNKAERCVPLVWDAAQAACVSAPRNQRFPLRG
jgi:hypothetical protein